MDTGRSPKSRPSTAKLSSRNWKRNHPDMQHNIRFLPPHIIERICQFLMDDQPIKLDGRLCAKWISEGVINVLRFRSTCRYFNQLVKEAFLDFSLYFDGRYLKYFDDVGTRNVELFLKLIKTDFNWRCSYLLINVLSIEKRWDFLQRILKILLTRKSIFGKGVRTLKIGKFAVFSARYADLISRLSPILSTVTNIYVKFEADSFMKGHNSRISDLSGKALTELKNLAQVKSLSLYTSELMDQEGGRLAMEETREIFKNVEDFSYSDCANWMPWRPILPCQFKKLNASRINGNELEEICNRTKSPQFPYLERLEMTVLHYENNNKHAVLPFFNYFTALTYLDLFTVSNLDDSVMITLPNSCKTLKILLNLLQRFEKCHHIENLCIKHEDYAEPQLNKWIEGSAMKLKIFVWVTWGTREGENDSFMEKIAIPVLQRQSSLEVLTIDSDARAAPINEQDFASRIEKYRPIMESHSCLKMFRFKEVFVVLRNSLCKQLINFVDYLDDECEWQVREITRWDKTKLCFIRRKIDLKAWQFTITEEASSENLVSQLQTV